MVTPLPCSAIHVMLIALVSVNAVKYLLFVGSVAVLIEK